MPDEEVVNQFLNERGIEVGEQDRNRWRMDYANLDDIIQNKISSQKKNEISFEKTKLAELFRHRVNGIITHEIVKQFAGYHQGLFNSCDYIFKDKNTLIGIELEVENVLMIDPNIPLIFWQITEDGSLRNRGREFKTYPTPLGYIEPALRLLLDGINKDVDFSKRTSIHVHMDMRHMTLSQLMGALFTYAVVENVLFKFAENERRQSIFCVPITETLIFTNLHKKPEHLFIDISNYWQKYTALNLLPIKTFGTFEFRQLPGTMNLKKILIWIDLLSRIRIFAYRNDFTTIMAKITELNTSSAYKEFIADVFGELAVYLDQSNLLSDMEKPAYILKHCGVTNDFHQWIIGQKNEKSSFSEQFKTSFNKNQLKALSHFQKKYFSKSTSPEETLDAVIEHQHAFREQLERQLVEFLIRDGPDPWAKKGEVI